MEYVNLVDKIITAEQNAQEMAEIARQKRATLAVDLDSERKKLREEYFQRAEKRIKTVHQQEYEMADAAIAELDAELAAELKKVDDIANENHKIWVEKLFLRVIGK